MVLVACLALAACKREGSLARGADFLGSIQRADGAICDTVNPLFDVWETVEAATALWAYRHDTTDPVLHKALAFLQANENAAGLLCHNQKCRASYCLETTSEYFILLADIYGKERIQARMDTIRKLQKPTGEWEIGNPDVLERKDFPSVTAFVLAAFQAAGEQPNYPREAVQWLVAQEVDRGNWGVAWEYYGTSAYAFWPIARALHADSSLAVQQMLENAIYRSQSTQIDYDHWEPKKDTPTQPSISAELQTALKATALQYLDHYEANTVAPINSIQYLVDHQRPDGSWDGGLFPIANARYRKEEYVFATARVMVAIQQHLAKENAE